MPDYCFYIHNQQSGHSVLFDIGARKDWWNHPPVVKKSFKSFAEWGVSIDEDVSELLKRGGVDLNSINSVILSHWHWDHSGNLALFPNTTELVVGPGFKELILPGYPLREDSPHHEDSFKNREVREISFDGDLHIGDFQAHDFFGDGSLYLLNVPGHAVGHIGAFVRTTPDTFVMLGGDATHHVGTFRPSNLQPLQIDSDMRSLLSSGMPGQQIHPDLSSSEGVEAENTRAYPLYCLNPKGGWYGDMAEAQKSVEAIVDFDADEKVLVCMAHDPGLRDVCEFFPSATMNDWKEKEWKAKTRWAFLNGMATDAHPAKPRLVNVGFYKDGKMLDSPVK